MLNTGKKYKSLFESLGKIEYYEAAYTYGTAVQARY
jgi:hypothetical protein